MSCSATAYRRIVRSVTPRSVAAARPSTTGRAWSISRNASSREAGRDIFGLSHDCGQKLSSIVRRLPAQSTTGGDVRRWVHRTAATTSTSSSGPGRSPTASASTRSSRATTSGSSSTRGCEAQPIVGGLGNIDTYHAPDFPGRPGFEGFTLRLFEPKTGLWRIWWASSVGTGRARRAGRRPLRGRRHRPLRVRRHPRRRPRARALRLERWSTTTRSTWEQFVLVRRPARPGTRTG